MILSSCSSTPGIKELPPSLATECPQYLPLLEKGDTNSLLLWKVETDNIYYECRDKVKALQEFYKQ